MALKFSLTISQCKSQFPTFLRRLFLSNSSSPSPLLSCSSTASIPNRFLPFSRPFCTSPQPPEVKKPNPRLVNFSPSDSESESDPDTAAEPTKSKLPAPYNPFSKTRERESSDPKNLAEVFAKIREDGLTNSAAKMFDGLSQDGLTHEALELFSKLKDKGEMPDVIAHTAVMEAYVEARQAKEAHKVFLRMLASGVAPNAYSYRVLIRGLAEGGEAELAKKYAEEMVERGMRPNAGTCVAVVEGLVRAGMVNEAKEMLQMFKAKGAVPEEDKLRDFVKNLRGTVPRLITNAFYSN